MNSLVIFRKNASHRTDSSQSRPSPRPKGPMMSDPKVVETGSLVTPVVTQPRIPRKGRSHQTVQAAEPAAAAIKMVSFAELYRELCCANDRASEREPFSSFRESSGVVDTSPQRYPRAELMMEFEYADPPEPEVSAEMHSSYGNGRDYQHSFM